MDMTLLQALLLFFFGALWGSFFYTLALRFIDGSMDTNPREALMGRSKCPHCGACVNPLFLFPLLGYLILQGKCASCKERISPLYPAAESGYGLLMLLFAHHFGITTQAMAWYLVAALGISISIIDLKTLRIPDSLLAIMMIISLYPLIAALEWKSPLFGLLLMGGFFLVIMLIFPGSFGGGDLKYAMLIGLMTGLEQAFVVLETALIVGAVTGGIYALVSGKGLKSKIPFGPFLTLGLIVSLVFGQDIVLIYYGLVR